MPNDPLRHARTPGWHSRRLVGSARAHRVRALALVGVVTAVVVGTVAVTNASAVEGTIPGGAIRAESFHEQHGVQLEGTNDVGGGRNVGWLASGDWMRYDGVDLGQAGSLTTSVRVAAAVNDGGTVELRVDSVTGQVIASIPISATGGWQAWVTRTDTRVSPGGTHDVFLVITSDHRWDFVNVNWFLVGGSDRPAPIPSATTVPGAPAPTPSATAAPTATSTTAGSGPTGTGWISVDPAEQAAKTAAFFARTPKPVTGNPVKVPEFHATCLVSHHADNDPIVFPGLAGASHNHTFFGNNTTNANSTPASLFAGTTSCKPKDDRSAYWVPTMYQYGRVVDPLEVTVYYGSRLKDPSRTQPFPFGMRMLVGDAKKQSDPQGNQFWCAGIGGEIGRSTDGTFPVCAPTAHLVRQVMFADCWDGKHLDSPNHKDHTANMNSEAACPASHPVPIPSVSFVLSYPLSGDTNGITLSSGTAVSMHADFFNAWDEEALAARVRNCLNQGYKCNADGNF